MFQGKVYLNSGREDKLNLFFRQPHMENSNICPLLVVNFDSVCLKGKGIHILRLCEVEFYMASIWNLSALNHPELKIEFQSVEMNCPLVSHTLWYDSLIDPLNLTCISYGVNCDREVF